MKRRRPLAIIVSSSLLAIVTACGTTEETNEAGFASGDGSVTFVPPAERAELPELTGVDLTEQPMSSRDFDAGVLVINIWGSWCPPCRKETPTLVSLSREFEDQGVQFLGIAVRESPAASQAFVQKNDVPYPSFSDEAGKLLLAFTESLPAAAVPTTYVIDRDGKVAARILSEVDETTLRQLIEQELGRR
ncbi:hypothetical protein BHE97_16990 [Aeromicrobium sp. PE09-221]|nr:hypothetical protein BHE97_16990 [Aeromicrobium sp. PE09-221]